jgi:N6-L-threonylcarbamoyladenine synthase
METRYREVRYSNRRREPGWLPPSIRSRILSTFKQVNNVCDILPVKDIRVEIGQFDVQAIMNPGISSKEYQEGPLKDFDSIQEYIKLRDKLTCHYQKYRPDIPCSSKLETDHVIPRSKGGTDRPDNLVCSCSEHNRLKGNMSYKEFTGKSKPRIKDFKEVPFMHVIKSHLVPLLRELKPVTITYGYITRWRRNESGLEKSHINDAISITDIEPVEYIGNSYQIKQVRKKKRSLHQMTPYSSKEGNPLSERKKQNTKEIVVKGTRWCLWDKVKINDVVGYISGFSHPGFNIKSITGELYKAISPKQVTFIQKNNNWIISRQII